MDPTRSAFRFKRLTALGLRLPGFCCHEHMGSVREDCWRKSVEFNGLPGGWRQLAHGVTYHSPVPLDASMPPPELLEAVAAAAEYPFRTILDIYFREDSEVDRKRKRVMEEWQESNSQVGPCSHLDAQNGKDARGGHADLTVDLSCRWTVIGSHGIIYPSAPHSSMLLLLPGSFAASGVLTPPNNLCNPKLQSWMWRTCRCAGARRAGPPGPLVARRIAGVPVAHAVTRSPLAYASPGYGL